QTLRRTPLHALHASLGARLVPFPGREMPVQYAAGLPAARRAVRTAAGLLDVSHRAGVIVRGERPLDVCNHVVSHGVSRLAEGQAQDAGLLNDRGTFEDDCLVYRCADRMMIVVNASNAVKDFAHIQPHVARFGVDLEDVSDSIALLALQGPDAERVL